jgi:hypothetical protein
MRKTEIEWHDPITPGKRLSGSVKIFEGDTVLDLKKKDEFGISVETHSFRIYGLGGRYLPFLTAGQKETIERMVSSYWSGVNHKPILYTWEDLE